MSGIYKRQVGGTHYKSMVIQPSEFINKNNIPFAEGNAIKYLCRHKQKNQKQDLEKAIHYCQMAIERDYPDKKDFLEEAEKEKKELKESYKESRRQTEERKEKEQHTNPFASFSDDLQNSIKDKREKTNQQMKGK